MSKNYIGLDNKKIEGVVKSLNNYLANLNLLYVKIHNLHWNVQGHSFFQLHSVFEGYYEGVAKSLDEVAERILTLGSRPSASMKEYMKLGTVEELESKGLTGEEAIDILEADFLTMIKDSRDILSMAEDAEDLGTANLMEGLIAEYEKALWMIKSYKAN